MWIWISGWIVCWILGFLLVWSHDKIIGASWKWHDYVISAIICLLIAPVAVIFGLICVPTVWLNKRRIYWDDKQQQIKTKSGKCVYDRKEVGTKFTKIFQRIETLAQKVKAIERSMTCTKDNTLQAQLQCGAKGHGKWVYAGGTKQKWDKTEHDISGNETITMKVMSYTAIGSDGFIFKCSDCGLEITKTAKELTATEREALRKLKLL